MPRNLLWLAPALALLTAAAPFTLSGEVTHVRDGDTIEVRDVPVRLDGLAAPERGAPGARAATAAMTTLVGGKVVLCKLNGARSYDRFVGVCYLDGVDLAATMVRLGVARDCPRYSDGRYRDIELAAATRGSPIRSIYQLPNYCH